MKGFFEQGAFQQAPGITPEQAKARRSAIEKMMGNYGNARYRGQGMAHAAQGVLNGLSLRKIDAQEEKARQQAAQGFGDTFGGGSSAFDDVFSTSGGGGGGFSPYDGGGEYAGYGESFTPTATVADDVMRAGREDPGFSFGSGVPTGGDPMISPLLGFGSAAPAPSGDVLMGGQDAPALNAGADPLTGASGSDMLLSFGQPVGGQQPQPAPSPAAGKPASAQGGGQAPQQRPNLSFGDIQPTQQQAPQQQGPAGPQGIARGIVDTAHALGVDPLDLATAISYETAGSFDPRKAGPTTQWGQHRGLIQFGQPQAQKYGVDWNDPLNSQLGADGAVANYLRDTGVKPGMGLIDIYSAINAGGVGRYNRSDANNGGAPGTVRDKVEQQMDGHRRKAAQLLGMSGDRNPTISTQGQAPAPSGWQSRYGQVGYDNQIKATPAQAQGQPQPAPQQAQMQSQMQAGGGMPELPQEFQYRGPSVQQIMGVLNDPYLSKPQRDYAMGQLQKAQQWEDPWYRHQMRVQYAQSIGWTPNQAQAARTRTLTDAEEQAMGLPTAGVYQMGADGSISTAYAAPKEVAQKERPMKQDASKRWRYTDGDKGYVFDLPEGGAAGGKDMTEGERRIFMFSKIQDQTGPAINTIEEKGFNPSNIQDKLANGVLGGNFFRSTEGQMYQAAAGAWSEGALRLSTGAAATPEEFERIMSMYFAQPGDSPETISFKRNMRTSYEGVLDATLRGDMEADIPTPLMFAIEAFYADQEKAQAGDARPAAQEWNGPTAGEVQSMQPMEVEAFMSAYPAESIPDDILEILMQQGQR